MASLDGEVFEAALEHAERILSTRVVRAHGSDHGVLKSKARSGLFAVKVKREYILLVLGW